MKLKTFFINLDRDKKRLESFTKDWQHLQHKLDVERVSGVLGHSIRHEKSQVSDFCRAHCTNGMIGCYASHLKIMKRIVEQGVPMALVLEDDAYPDKNFEKYLLEILQGGYLPKDFDIVLFGIIWRNAKTAFLVHQLIMPEMARPHKQINEWIEEPVHPAGAYGYLISQKGAQRILQHYGPIHYHVDAYLFSRPDLRVYALSKPIIFTHDSDASLGEPHQFQILDPQLTWILHCAAFRIAGIDILVWHIILIALIALISVFTVNIPVLCLVAILNILFIKIYREMFSTPSRA